MICSSSFSFSAMFHFIIFFFSSLSCSAVLDVLLMVAAIVANRPTILLINVGSFCHFVIASGIKGRQCGCHMKCGCMWVACRLKIAGRCVLVMTWQSSGRVIVVKEREGKRALAHLSFTFHAFIKTLTRMDGNSVMERRCVYLINPGRVHVNYVIK